jgi:DNA polymerase-3 subunit chi
MAEVGFYHLTRSTLADALPQLLSRTLAAGQRALVLGTDPARLDALSAALWAQPAWLPHGTTVDGDPDLQPIWLSTDPDPSNAAGYLFLIDGAEIDRIKNYQRIFDLFDGNSPEAVTSARRRWKTLRDAGHTLIYWQQTETGWSKKA